MILYLVFFISVLAIQLVITILGKDAWPFSSYIMFSNSHDVSNVRVFRIALEKNDGEIIWWRSNFYRYPEYVGRTLKRIHQLKEQVSKFQFVVALENRKHLLEVARLIAMEEGDISNYKAFHIIERTAVSNKDAPISINDKTVATVSFSDLETQLGES